MRSSASPILTTQRLPGFFNHLFDTAANGSTWRPERQTIARSRNDTRRSPGFQQPNLPSLPDRAEFSEPRMTSPSGRGQEISDERSRWEPDTECCSAIAIILIGAGFSQSAPLPAGRTTMYTVDIDTPRSSLPTLDQRQQRALH
jgi:hypothetical protein